MKTKIAVNMTPVVSSNIETIGYDDKAEQLYVHFYSGKTYRYDGVPEGVYTDLMGSASKGRAFETLIRRAGYTVKEVN
jgi:hypothetical protein